MASERLKDVVGCPLFDGKSHVPDGRARVCGEQGVRVGQQCRINPLRAVRSGPVFHFKHVRRVATQMSVRQRLQNGCLVHDGTPAGIDQKTTAFHLAQAVSVERVQGMFIKRQGQYDDVGFGQQVIKL